MRTRTSSRLLFSSVLVLALLPPLTAHAQANEAEAKIHYQKGVDLYTEGAYTTALAELEQAYALSPHYRVLYSLALVRAQLSDFVGALRGFQEYQAAAVDESPQRKAEVKERIDQLLPKVASVTVKVNVEDAEVYIDDQLKGTSPFAQPILVNPGKHVMYAKKGTSRSDPKTMTLAAGAARISFEIDAPAATTTPVVLAPETAPVPRTESSGSFVTIGLIATGVLAAGAVTTGLLTLSARSDLEEKQNAPNKSADLTAASDKISTMALVTDLLAGAAILAGGVTVYAILRKKPQASTGAAARTWITAGPTSMGVAGTF